MIILNLSQGGDMNQEKKQLIDNIDLIMKYVPFNWNAILVRHDTYAPESIRFVHVLPDSPKEYYIDINRESRTEYKLKEFTKSKIYIYEESIKKELPICNDEIQARSCDNCGEKDNLHYNYDYDNKCSVSILCNECGHITPIESKSCDNCGKRFDIRSWISSCSTCKDFNNYEPIDSKEVEK